MGRIFAGAALIMLPFIFEAGQADEVRLPKAKFLLLLSLLYLAYELGRKIDVWLGLFAAWVAICAYRSTAGFPWEDTALFFGAVSSAFWVAKARRPDIALRVFLAVGTALAAYALLQINGFDPIIRHHYDWADTWRPTALFGQSTLYGPYAVAVFLVALFLNYYFLAPFLLIPILFIDSSFTYLGLLGGIFVYLASKLKRCHLISLLLLCSLLLWPLWYFSSSKIEEALNDKGRFALWSQVMELSNQHWIAGFGLGSFKYIYPGFQLPEVRKNNGIDDAKLTPKQQAFMKQAERIKSEMGGVALTAHNDFLNAYFEFGLVGVLLILGMVINFWQKVREPLFLAMMLAFCLNSMGSFGFRLVPQVLIPLWIYVIVVSRSGILHKAS